MVTKFDSFEPVNGQPPPSEVMMVMVMVMMVMMVNGQPPPSEVGKLSDCLTQTRGTKTETRLVRQTGDTRHVDGQAEDRNLNIPEMNLEDK